MSQQHYNSSQWHYHQNGVQYGPVTAKQLKELAVVGQLQPMDQVCAGGAWIAAEKIAGLIYDVPRGDATVNVLWQGVQSGLIDMSVIVRFNGNLIGNGSLIKGFRFSAPTTIGRHTLGVKLSFPLKREKQYVLDIQQASVYNVGLSYNLFWGNFVGECDFSLDREVIHSEAVIQRQWDAERQIGQCPSCGVEWVAVYRGNKVINKEYVPRTVTREQQQYVENPNFHPLNASYVPQHLHGGAQWQEQVTMTVETMRHFFKCEQCSNKWTGDTTREYIE